MPSNLNGNGKDRDADEKSDVFSLIRDINAEAAIFMYAMAILAAIGCLLILLYSFRFWDSGQVLRIVGVGMLTAGAAMLSGFLLGFIFAIPRVGAKEKSTATPPAADATTEDSDEQQGSVPYNANLVEISDWLTKIIVGVGLVELHAIPGKLGELSYYLAPGLLPSQCPGGAACTEPLIVGQAAGLSILIYYFALGFLLGYVWTMIPFKHNLEAQLKQLKKQKRTLQRLQQAALKIMPPKASVILAAEASLSANKLDEAMASIDAALKNDPENGLAVMTKARILKRMAFESGQPARERLLREAVEASDRAITLLPDKGEPLYNKACYEALLDARGLKGDILRNLRAAIHLNAGLRQTARVDADLASLSQDAEFIELTGISGPAEA